ncbi:DUF4073 domain-containing protein [Paenibacillus tritici]|uniref:DUF4073 domain-containing protein n=1 Tax=Paenibacillus tritici TaxID=1873425 RepID=A0ABX2DMR9_9BACL|nr:DUF4073 domain-containing protein [Paenibacillus tritici]NQX45527.1 DUF4073 domain-containing protein [Paenibacillus tritici]
MRGTVNKYIRLSLIGVLFTGTVGTASLGVHSLKAYASDEFNAAGHSSPSSMTLFSQPPWPPNVTADDEANTIIGANEKMEYSTDEGLNWTAYDPLCPPVFCGDLTVQVRIAGDSVNYIPAGFIKTLTFTADTPDV